jgi:hypothetical protein
MASLPAHCIFAAHTFIALFGYLDISQKFVLRITSEHPKI